MKDFSDILLVYIIIIFISTIIPIGICVHATKNERNGILWGISCFLIPYIGLPIYILVNLLQN